MLVQKRFADEGKDDTGYKGLEDFEQPWHSSHVASDLTRPCASPSHFSGIGQTGDTGEGGGGDGVVPGTSVSHELHIGGGVYDGRRQAEESCVAGIGDGEVSP